MDIFFNYLRCCVLLRDIVCLLLFMYCLSVYVYVCIYLFGFILGFFFGIWLRNIEKKLNICM